MTEAALAGLGEGAMRAAGAEGYAYSTILSSQERTNAVFGRPTQRKLEDGSFITIGISPKKKIPRLLRLSWRAADDRGGAASPARLYPRPVHCLQIDRSAAAPRADGERALPFLAAGARQIRFGKSIRFTALCIPAACSRAEAPFLCPDPDWEFQPGMVLLIDLAIFHPRLWGIRWESGYLITEAGAEHLSNYFDTAAEIVLQRAAQAA